MLNFRWDRRKAAANFARHGISFLEASTAFEDPLSITIPDPGHSVGEQRFRLVGTTRSGRTVVVALRSAAITFESSQPDSLHETSAGRMKKTTKSEYDFSGGVRGKYAKRYREGTNVVVLDPDVAAVFKTSRAVNRALRTLLPNRRQGT